MGGAGEILMPGILQSQFTEGQGGGGGGGGRDL